ncbi:MAG: YidH family protein [Ferrimicrobium sp.]
MSGNVSDHLANERTYLAWIRSGIAVMAFGFLVEKFTLFLNYLRQALHESAPIAGGSSAEVIGVFLIALGVVAIAAATIRFRNRTREIDRSESSQSFRSTSAVVVGTLLAVVGAVLAVFLSVQLR